MTGYGLMEWVDVMEGRIGSKWDAPLILLLLWTSFPIILAAGLMLFRSFTRHWVSRTLLRQDREAYDSVWRQVCKNDSGDQEQGTGTAPLDSLLRVADAVAALVPPGPPPVLLQRHSGGVQAWEMRPEVESVELIFGQAAVAAAYLRQHVQVRAFARQKHNHVGQERDQRWSREKLVFLGWILLRVR
jgi:hypothetical protein